MTAISAGWVLPVDGPPLEDAYVAWEDGRIVEIGHGPCRAPLRRRDDPAGARQRALAPRVRRVRRLRRRRDLRRLARHAHLPQARARLRRHGRHRAVAARRTRSPPASRQPPTTASPAPRRTAAERLGLRAIVYLEVFGVDPEQTAESFAALRERAPETDLVAHRRLASRARTPARSTSIAGASRSAFRSARTSPRARPRTNGSRRAPAPCRRSRSSSSSRPAGAPPARSRTCSAPNFSARTASTSTMTRSRELARLDVPVAHCPRSNALLGCGTAPLAALRAAGVRVGLGTDSPASTPSFDVWEELRTAVYMSRAREQRPDILDADAALRLATIDAARAIGLDQELGSLTPGKKADLTVLSVAGSPYDPVEDPAVAAVFGGSPAGILETIVDGTTRYRQGETAWQEVRSTASAARQRMLP